MTGLLLLLKYIGTKGCCYDYNWPFQKTILLRVVDTNTENCCLNKTKKYVGSTWMKHYRCWSGWSWFYSVNTDDTSHLHHVLISMQVMNPPTGFHYTDDTTQSLPDPTSNAQKCWSPPTRSCSVISQKTIQIKLLESESTQDSVYKTNPTLDLILASKAAQMVSTFTHSLQHVQLLSTFGGCFHY